MISVHDIDVGAVEHVLVAQWRDLIVIFDHTQPFGKRVFCTRLKEDGSPMLGKSDRALLADKKLRNDLYRSKRSKKQGKK